MIDKFLKCIQDKIDAGDLSPSRGQKIKDEYNRLYNKHVAAGHTPQGAFDALTKKLANEQKVIDEKERNLLSFLNESEKIQDEMAIRKGSAYKKVEGYLQSVKARQDAIYNNVLGVLAEAFETQKVNWLGHITDFQDVVDGVRWIIDEGKGDFSPNAQALGKSFSESFKFLAARYRAANGLLGNIQNYVPQTHDRWKIIGNDRSETGLIQSKRDYVKFTMDRLDREKMLDHDTSMPLSDQQLEELVGRSWESFYEGEGRGRIGDIDTRHSMHRVFHFKSGDAYLEYNAKFGSGNEGLLTSLLLNMKAMARDTALLEVMTSRPGAMMNIFEDLIHKEGVKAGKSVNRKMDKVRGQFNVLSSKFQPGDPDDVVMQALNIAHNYMRAAKLGSAMISSFTDLPFTIATLRSQGLPVMPAMEAYIGTLVPGSTEAKEAHRVLGAIAQDYANAAKGGLRYGDAAPVSQGKKLMDRMSRGMRTLTDVTYTASFLDGHTKKVRFGAGYSLAVRLGEAVEGKLPRETWGRQFSEALENYGINEKDWNFLLANGKLVSDRTGPLFNVKELRRQKFKSMEDQRFAFQLANKLEDWNFDLQRRALNEPSLATQAFMRGASLARGAGGEGTVSKAIGNTIGMFKNFPIEVARNHFFPLLDKERSVGSRLEHAAWGLMAAGLVGTVAYQAKQVAYGKTPMSWEDPRLYIAGAFQSTALGVIGDLIFSMSGEDRFGHNFFEQQSGPLLSLVSDVAKTALSGFQELTYEGALLAGIDPTGLGFKEKKKKTRSKFKQGTMDIIRYNTPVLSTLWYGKLMWNRLLVDQFELFIDETTPDRIRKSEKALRRETGQEYFWKKGSLLPERFK